MITHTYICRICGDRSEKLHRVESACDSCREIHGIGDCEPTTKERAIEAAKIILLILVIIFATVWWLT